MDGLEWQRGVPQILSGICWLIMATVLTGRSLHRNGLVWPLRWHLLTGLAMGAAGWVQLTHGIYWMGWFAHELNGWRLWLPLWLQTVLTGAAFWRWLRDPDEAR